MRIAALAALLLLLSACAQSTTGQPRPAPEPASTTAAAPSSTPPDRDSQLNDRIRWVQAGNAVDNARYGTVSMDGKPPTDLKGDIAFVSPSGKISCITGAKYDIDGLTCVVKLKNPPPAPAGGLGNWSPGYTTYSTKGVTVGAFRGDPGLFIDGEGQTLPYDSTITFGAYTCRIVSTGLTCVNPTIRTGVQLSDDGIIAYGCLHELTAAERKDYVAQEFTC
ncbi:hypothetical protein OG874_30535 [Nocardia sp. NBC_00565]|uniref:hypothetical protein n=1 Tax=Nocardia sp. NBC_00565 TaxID=2975993 RepID=UPI002E810BB1|nr:hypothetical protein [Nocardia sp. NBC_00565]WUC01134.1 hypothetical protein OG874_30535 [Nocardia sp. NBC_00565]